MASRVGSRAGAALGVALCGACLSLAAWADQNQDRERFREGWAAAGRGDQAAMLRAIRALPDYVLRPYLEYELLRQRLDQVPESAMSQFLARYRDWSFAPGMQAAWLRRLAKRGDYETLARHGADASDPIIRCHLARADLAAGRLQGLAERAAELWMVAHSQPDDCDPLFQWWRRQGHLSNELAWRRFELALARDQKPLAGYLVRYLDPDWKIWARHWLNMRERPSSTLRQARNWTDQEVARRIVFDGLTRMAVDDWSAAVQFSDSLANRFDFTSDQLGRLKRQIALFRAVDLEREAIAEIDALPNAYRDQQMLAWRARVALAHADWTEVLNSISAMSLREQGRGRWRYWRGRALAALQRPEAALAYATVAGESSYYGFLAALQLNQPLALCAEEIPVDAPLQRRLMRDAEFERALELHQVGLNAHARSTWVRVMRRLSAAEQQQAALLAAGQGWHDRVISVLGNLGKLSAYSWRFPLIEQTAVANLARRYQVDQALIYGLMRAESAMQADARSAAGARGLLQLIPSTAGQVARRNGLAYQRPSDLEQPSVNLALGIAHLAELQQRFDGRRIDVAAAYNAGPAAVQRWLDERPRPAPDIWLETLPFHETRDYVPRVLAFATIYEWRLKRPALTLADELRPSSSGVSAMTFVCQS